MPQLSPTAHKNTTVSSSPSSPCGSPRSKSTPRTTARIKRSGGRTPIIRSEKSYLNRKKDFMMKENNEDKVAQTKLVQTDSDCSETSFEDHSELSNRVAKSMYFANKLPSIPRPSLPLTTLAVNAFTKGTFAPKDDSLEFLDLEVAAEIGRSACVSPTSLIMALVYMERLSNHNPGYLSASKPSELFVVSLLVASKFIQDDGEDVEIWNDEWANSAKMDLKRVNKLELQFLTAIDWKVNVTKEEYDKVLRNVEGKLALNQGLDRGWFTYTEIGSLTQTFLTWNAIWPTLLDYYLMVVSAACMIYTTLLATVVTSSILGPQIFILSKSMLLTNIFPSHPYDLSTISLPFCGAPPQSLSNSVLNSNISTAQGSRYQNTFSNNLLDEENETDVNPMYEGSNSALFNANGCQNLYINDMDELISSLPNLNFNILESKKGIERFEYDDNGVEDLPFFHHKSVSLRGSVEEAESVFVQNLGHLLSSHRDKCNSKQYFGRLGFPNNVKV